MRKWLIGAVVVLVVPTLLLWWKGPDLSLPFAAPKHEPGDVLDSLHGVHVYHNDGMRATHGRHVVDGYNVGLKYQCGLTPGPSPKERGVSS